MEIQNKPIIFIDTSVIRDANHKSPDFQKLFELSKNNKVEIHMSEIATEEWRTKNRDNLLADLSKARSALRQLNHSWKNDFITNNLDHPIDQTLLPKNELIEEESRKATKVFLSENKINTLKSEPDHQDRVFSKYFEGEKPFRSPKNRDDIPDGFIFESAVDLYDASRNCYCLVRDTGLSKALEDLGYEIFPTASELLDIIKPLITPEPEPAKAEPKPSEEAIEEKVTAEQEVQTETLNKSLAVLADKNKQLQIKILGYAKWFDPLPKDDLIKLIESPDHSPEQIENTAKQLALSGFLKNTRNYYISIQSDISEQAAAAVKEEILRLMDES